MSILLKHIYINSKNNIQNSSRIRRKPKVFCGIMSKLNDTGVTVLSRPGYLKLRHHSIDLEGSLGNKEMQIVISENSFSDICCHAKNERRYVGNDFKQP